MRFSRFRSAPKAGPSRESSRTDQAPQVARWMVLHHTPYDVSMRLRGEIPQGLRDIEGFGDVLRYMVGVKVLPGPTARPLVVAIH